MNFLNSTLLDTLGDEIKDLQHKDDHPVMDKYTCPSFLIIKRRHIENSVKHLPLMELGLQSQE